MQDHDLPLDAGSATASAGGPRRWPRHVLRALALALLCGAVQALLPRYTLGGLALAPLSVVLGIAVAAAMSRGRWALPGALVGVLLAEWTTGHPPAAAAAAAAVLGLQAALAGWLMRHADDPGLLQLDSWPRLRRFVLVAAPAAALLGVLAGAWLPGSPDPAAAGLRALLAGAVGRFVADAAGIVVTAPVLLAWLGRPTGLWRPRRRLVALPLLLLTAVMLPGIDQVARRDELRLQNRFSREAELRRVRVQQLLSDPLDAASAMRGVLAAAGAQAPTALFNRQAEAWAARLPGLQALGWLEAPAADGDWRLAHRHGPDGVVADRLLPAAVPRALLAQAAAGDRPVALPLGAADGAARLLLLQPVPAEAERAGAAPRLVFALVDLRRLLAAALPDDEDPNERVCITAGGRAPGGAAGVATPAGTPPGALLRLAGPPGCETDALANALRVQPFRLTLAEQRFDGVVTEPPTADNRLFTAVWLLALPAVAGAAMLAAMLLAISGRLRRIEAAVAARTAALQAEIDERRQAEARLAVSEQRFRAIFDSVNIGVTLVDPQGTLVQVNPAFCTMMGCAAGQLVGRPLAEFRLPDVAEDDGTAAAVAGVDARRQRYLTADGRVLQVAASLRTLRDSTGAPVATMGALQDLTQVLRLREAEREREQAEIASRAKSDFLARLSHELRAPLNAIIGFAQMAGDADEPLAGGERQAHGLARIRQAGWHLLDMINDVLDLSRMEAGALRLTLQPVALADLVQEAAAMVEPAAEQAQVRLELSLSPQAETVQADPVRLRQVLVNLLGNAIKYNRRGGRVTLRTRPAGVGEVAIEVEDTGIGMSEAQLAQLYQPFNRLGREAAGGGAPGTQGTGIGLVICRRLAELMAGELSASSQEGAGSCFTLRLPRPAGAPQRVEVSAAMPLGPQVSIGTVLYIEDSEADTALMRRLLQQRPGVTLVCAHTAQQGLAVAHEADLILLDLDLPDRPGLDLLRQLRADTRLRRTPVIVVSAETRPQRIDECFDAGAAQFLTKPLDAPTTLRAIDDGLQA